ncbi:MAG: hypothetical protein AB4050_04175 [Synechococcus sp.]
MPARTICFSTSDELLAGPMVATILVCLGEFIDRSSATYDNSGI